MTLTIEVTPEQLARLREEARRQGWEMDAYLQQRLRLGEPREAMGGPFAQGSQEGAARLENAQPDEVVLETPARALPVVTISSEARLQAYEAWIAAPRPITEARLLSPEQLRRETLYDCEEEETAAWTGS